MFKQVRRSKETIFGTSDVSRNINPTLIGTIRRKDPDGSSPEPYFTGLTGTSLIVQLAGDFSGTITIPFAVNSYAEAIMLINTYSPSNLQAQDQDGFLKIRNLNAGNNNSIKVLPCTSAAIFGFAIDPHPASISYAGEIGQTLPTIYENPTQQSTMIAKNETVSRQNINRAIASISSIVEPIINDLEKEITIPKSYDVTINGSSFSITSSDRFFINANNNTTINPSSDILDNFINLTDTNNNLLFDSTGSRIRISSVTYGALVDAASSFSSWSVADGKSVFGTSSHWIKTKASTSITSIIGNTITCSGGNFQTIGVVPNDTIKITGATNNTPFNHNGEFLVEAVISNTILQVKPKGISDYNFTSVNTPSCLNPNKNTGESYGTATIYIGRHLPLTLPGGNMVFNLTNTLANGIYRITLPIGRTIRQLLSNDLTQSTINYPFGGQLEVGSKLISVLSDALKPRIISKPNSTATLTLFAEFKNGTIGSRIYTANAGGLYISQNATFDNTNWNKDTSGQQAFILRLDKSGLFLYSKQATDNTAWTINGGDQIIALPNYDGTLSSIAQLNNGIVLGTSLTTDPLALIPKIEYTCTTTSNKYTLLSETILSNSRIREYAISDGSSIRTTNAKWNGTQWIKDTATASSKLVMNIEDFSTGLGSNLKFYTHNLTTTPFADTDWSNIEDIKKYQLDDDFNWYIFNNIPDSTGDRISPNFIITSVTNCRTEVADSFEAPGSIGAFTINSNASGAYSLTIQGNPLYIGTGDFEFKIRAGGKSVSTLTTPDTGTTNGAIIGNNTGDSNNLSFKIGGTGAWRYQVGTTLINTGISTGTLNVLTITRVNGILNAFVDNTLVDSRSFTNSVTFTPEIHINGTYTGSTSILTLDFLKLWLATTAK